MNIVKKAGCILINMKEKDAIYMKPDFSEEDGMKAAE